MKKLLFKEFHDTKFIKFVLFDDDTARAFSPTGKELPDVIVKRNRYDAIGRTEVLVLGPEERKYANWGPEREVIFQCIITDPTTEVKTNVKV